QTIVRLEDLRACAAVPIDAKEPRYREPLVRDAAALAAKLPAAGRAGLLGSIASNKYVEILHAAFGDRLGFPQAFVGRGDMRRGALRLRAGDAGEELAYVPVMGSVRRAASEVEAAGQRVRTAEGRSDSENTKKKKSRI